MVARFGAPSTAMICARLWPPTAPEDCRIAVARAGSPPGALRLSVPEGAPPLDVDPMSGDVFVGRRRLDTGPDPRPAPDLWLRLRRRRNPRAAVALVYRGFGDGLSDFVTDCLPTLFALDALDPEGETVAQLPLRLGRQAFVQDALEDGLFRPRRVEIMYPRKLVAARCVLVPEAPPPDAAFLAALWARLAAIYPASPDGAAEVVLCRGGPARAATLGLPEPVIDPAALRLDTLVTILRAARTVTVPDTGELAAVALAGSGRRAVRIVAAGGKPSPRLDALATAAGWAYEQANEPARRR